MKTGLSHDDIKEQINDLQFNLPEEIYELYGWHNGNIDQLVFENFNFLPLKTALAAYYESLGEISYRNIVEAYFFEKSFPVFQLWSDSSVLLCVICDASNDYPIRMIDISCKDYSFLYRNLTDLILHVAEWYESAQYYDDAQTTFQLDSKYLIQI
ncbi:SMI1/KNR4 family protein [Dulcicalothrix desertica]|uniref:SMI1/KNR4 family protein n=2 Tax=Dulcicalothrix desertica TaxID=32056 RepID=UPI002D78C145|nr:SMI1/KNR4 family protein [Dulcicalothrix desertica]